MASISTDKAGRRSIQFSSPTSDRRPIVRLGRVSQRIADDVRRRIELIVAAIASRTPVDRETAAWVGEISDELHERLVRAGIVPSRKKPKRTPTFLKSFCADYIASRTDLDPGTITQLGLSTKRVVGFLGAGKELRTITPADGDRLKIHLLENWSEATAGRTLKHARQFLTAAKRAKIIAENPLDGIKAPSMVNAAREFFVTREAYAEVARQLPDDIWRAIFALSRIGGLRTPSEHFAITWDCFDWRGGRFEVDSPKTGKRTVPIFAELIPALEAIRPANARSGPVFTRHLGYGALMRKVVMAAIKKAGLAVWPRLFQNLRASRETELTNTFPLHVVCAWLGNSPVVAAKHYLQVTDEHFERAAMRIPMQPAPDRRSHASEFASVAAENAGNPVNMKESMTPTGFEKPQFLQDLLQISENRCEIRCDPLLAAIVGAWGELTPEARVAMAAISRIRDTPPSLAAGACVAGTSAVEDARLDGRRLAFAPGREGPADEAHHANERREQTEGDGKPR